MIYIHLSGVNFSKFHPLLSFSPSLTKASTVNGWMNRNHQCSIQIYLQRCLNVSHSLCQLPSPPQRKKALFWGIVTCNASCTNRVFISYKHLSSASSHISSKRFIMVTIALVSASEQTHYTLVVCDLMGDYSAFWTATELVTALFSCYMAGNTCCHLITCFAYTIQPCTRLLCHWTGSHICVYIYIYRVHVCLAVTCHLHFWQNEGDL